MADSSTAAGPILDLIAGGCWARCPLCSGIKDVSVASEPMKSLTLVGVVFIGTLALPEPDVRFLHNRCADSGSDCVRLLVLTPATRQYKVRLCGIKGHESTNPSESVLFTKVMEDLIADNSMTTGPILDLISGGCWPQHQLPKGISSSPPLPLLIRLQC